MVKSKFVKCNETVDTPLLSHSLYYSKPVVISVCVEGEVWASDVAAVVGCVKSLLSMQRNTCSCKITHFGLLEHFLRDSDVYWQSSSEIYQDCNISSPPLPPDHPSLSFYLPFPLSVLLTLYSSGLPLLLTHGLHSSFPLPICARARVFDCVFCDVCDCALSNVCDCALSKVCDSACV